MFSLWLIEWHLFFQILTHSIRDTSVKRKLTRWQLGGKMVPASTLWCGLKLR